MTSSFARRPHVYVLSSRLAVNANLEEDPEELSVRGEGSSVLLA